ncbi:disease resistance protein RPS2 [Vigna unguiculata]|uniref:Disease resistance protein RPS2 n=1 Tax=Vigna unguiculata TaxID=3917 RepID=A0A4D6L809_VIGUN|nr:disease resistance protein RPS2 [Vigna unguiculata]
MASSVFVSFHHEDINFITGCVLDPLRNRGIHVFVKGESKTFDLFQAIERSRLFIVVLSKNYASSICCLRELVAIINGVESSPRSVLPIFYGVHQSEVLFQNGCYGKAFSKHEERFREHKKRMEEVQTWREALTRVAVFRGLHMKNATGHGGFDFVQYAINIVGPEFSTPQDEAIYEKFEDIVQSKDGDEVSYKELRGLVRLRDFISLMLTYPVKLEEDGVLRSWISAFPEWKAELFSTGGYPVIYKPWSLLTEKALRCMKGFMPVEIMAEIESGERSIFNRDNDVILEGLLPLIVDLAVNQLIQTLFSGDYCARYIRLLTRNSAEKESVVSKIVSALEDKHNLFGIDKDFLMAVWINALTRETDAEVQVQEEINKIMGSISITEGDDMLTTLDTDEKKRRNRLLVIVVDADSNRKKLDLQKVQFPTGIVVLITTESSTQAVMDDGIASTMDLNIWTQDHLLPWKLFNTYVGSCISCSTVGSSTTIQTIAVEIVKKIHGHLLAIVLVAKHLRNVKDDKYWELVLDKLSSRNPFYDYQDCDRIGISRVMVNAFVNIIWEDIDDELKLCLQLSLPVRNIKNGVRDDILVSYWANILRYTQEVGEYKRQLQYYLEELLDCFVLLEFESGDVYLPIEAYDIIKSLHISQPSIIRHSALGLTEIGQWHSLIQLELIDNKICELPQSPDCPKLKVLLLQGNADLLDIPDSFFDHMPLLQHLDLSYTSIRDLPPSLTKLIQLKKLYLKGCDLFMEISPQIFQLKNLEELDLDGTLITHLPKDIQELINLQRLALCFDAYHHVLSRGKKGMQISNTLIIPPGVISNLTRLNYLSLDVDPEDEQWTENVNSVLLEILGLEKLKTVSIYVPETDLLELIPGTKSLNFRLVVGHHIRRLISRVPPELETKFKQCNYSMKFVNGVNVPNGVKMNLERFKALYLDRHMTIKSLSDFNLSNLGRLKVCILAECNEMETIFDGGKSSDEPVSLMLEFLSVFYMKNLRNICQECCPFSSIKYIALHTCPMLTTIFTISTFISIPLLEEISVEDCPKVTTLIIHDSPEERRSAFSLPKLRVISLLYLPNLVNIFNGLRVEHALEEMIFYCCPKLQSLSRSELPWEYLKFIKGESMWWEALDWSVSEWGYAGRPKFLEQFFKPITMEADMKSPPAAHQETQLNEYHGTMYQGVSSSTELMTKLHLETPLLSLSGSKEGEAQKRKAVIEPIIFSPPLLKRKPNESFRRRTPQPSMKVIRTKNLDDGYSWRKYGQKEILGAKYTRGYYRCTYRNTHGCQATKQVQRFDEKPTTFEVNYRGTHTCTQKQDLIAESGDEEVFEDFIAKPDSSSATNKNDIFSWEEITAELEEPSQILNRKRIKRCKQFQY